MTSTQLPEQSLLYAPGARKPIEHATDLAGIEASPYYCELEAPEFSQQQLALPLGERGKVASEVSQHQVQLQPKLKLKPLSSEKMRERSNPVRNIRERLKMSQSQFAQVSGVSYGAIQRYEAGATPSPGARTRIAEVAQRYGIGDEVDDWIADRDGTSMTPVVEAVPQSGGPKTTAEQMWVAKLLRILRSGHAVAADTVTKNLIAFEHLAEIDRPRAEQTAPRKRA